MMTAPEEGRHTSSGRHLSARKALGRNIQQLRVFAIYFFGKQYTTNRMYIFLMNYLTAPKGTSFFRVAHKLGKKTTAVGSGWYVTWGQVPGKLVFLLKG